MTTSDKIAITVLIILSIIATGFLIGLPMYMVYGKEPTHTIQSSGVTLPASYDALDYPQGSTITADLLIISSDQLQHTIDGKELNNPELRIR